VTNVKGTEFSQSTIARRWAAQDPSLKFPVLLPVFDLANHSPNARVTWRPSNESAGLIGLTNDLVAGGEVFNNYGQKSNEELILGYGFDLALNAANSFLIAIDVSLAKEKLQYIRILIAGALSGRDIQTLLPQIMNPGTPLDDATKIFALRGKQDPLTSAAATPLSLMSTNARELRLRAANPLAIPNLATRLPTRNGLEVLRALAKVLRKDHDRIRSTDNNLPSQADIDASYHMQLGMRHRQTQLEIIEHGLASLKQTFTSWQSQHKIVTTRALLRTIGPRSILKKFRKLVHRTLGTRDEDALHENGHDEALFMFWIVHTMHELDTTDDVELDKLNEDQKDVLELRSWIARMRLKMETAYGPYGGERKDDIVDELCRGAEERAEAELHASEYESLIEGSGLLDGIENLKAKLLWAARVVIEETIWIEDWLDPRIEEPSGEQALVWVMEDEDEQADGWKWSRARQE